MTFSTIPSRRSVTAFADFRTVHNGLLCSVTQFSFTNLDSISYNTLNWLAVIIESCHIFTAHSADNAERGRVCVGHWSSLHRVVHIRDPGQRQSDGRGSTRRLQRVSAEWNGRWRTFVFGGVDVLAGLTTALSSSRVTDVSWTTGVHWPRHLLQLHLHLQYR